MKYDLIVNSMLTKKHINNIYHFDEELDDISAVSSEITDEFLEENIEFDLSLNGIPIPVYIWGDFDYFLDGFQDFINFLFCEEELNYTYELYGQGIETTIGFIKKNNVINVTESKFLKSNYDIQLQELQYDSKIFYNKLKRLVYELLPGLTITDLYKDFEFNVETKINFSQN